MNHTPSVWLAAPLILPVPDWINDFLCPTRRSSRDWSCRGRFLSLLPSWWRYKTSNDQTLYHRSSTAVTLLTTTECSQLSKTASSSSMSVVNSALDPGIQKITLCLPKTWIWVSGRQYYPEFCMETVPKGKISCTQGQRSYMVGYKCLCS